MRKYTDIIRIEAEISGYRKACLRATIYLDRRLVAFTDSQQWNNNFLRSMSAESVDQVVVKMREAELLSWNENYPECRAESGEDTPFPFEQWVVTLTFSDGSVIVRSGSQNYPPQWKGFREMIESALRIPFRIR